MKLTRKTSRAWLWFMQQAAKDEQFTDPEPAREPLSFRERDADKEEAERAEKRKATRNGL